MAFTFISHHPTYLTRQGSSGPPRGHGKRKLEYLWTVLMTTRDTQATVNSLFPQQWHDKHTCICSIQATVLDIHPGVGLLAEHISFPSRVPGDSLDGCCSLNYKQAQGVHLSPHPSVWWEITTFQKFASQIGIK